MLAIASTCVLIVWVAVWLLPSQPHRTRERFALEPAPVDLDEVAVLIPARNEADVIDRTLAALAYQGRNLLVLVVDDESTDATAAICRGLGDALSDDDATVAPQEARFGLRIELISGQPLPRDWAGKLWALQQGLDRIDRPYTLLLDADIELDPGVIPALLQLASRNGASLVSIMATLRCVSFWERLLVPPFVFFFKLLFPFARVNADDTATAAAAGGCMLIDSSVLRSVGAFDAMRGALIDDCTLAARIKRHQHRIWLGLSHSVRSLRAYSLSDFWQMVSRTAFTQLKYSVLLLLLTSIVMLALFVAPLAAVLWQESPASTIMGALAVIAMGLAFAPIVRFYELPVLWAFTLPLASILFLAMTWSSAVNYWRGTRARWKSRAYEVADT